jgi:glycosyltransferase involved in cell wall biosynthesis
MSNLINFYKGLDVVVEGVKQAILNGIRVELGVHGKISSVTGEQYIDSLKRSLKECEDFVSFIGAYDSQDVLHLMGQYHFVIMGSRWYENSPVVIQEALEANRPLIVPSLGGMREKVEGTGLFYRPGDPTSLQALLQGLTTDLYSDLSGQVEERRIALSKARNLHKSAVMDLYGVLA